MKKIMNIFIISLLAVLFVTCSEDEIIKSVVIEGPKPVANFTVARNEMVLTFTNNSTEAKTYYWEFGDGTSSTERSPSPRTYASTGIYRIVLTVKSAAGYADKTEETIVIAGDVEAFFTFFRGDGLSMNFDARPSANAKSVVWDFGDKSNPSTDFVTQHTFPAEGTYEVKLTATGWKDDVNSITLSVKVTKPNMSFSQFTQGGGGANNNYYHAKLYFEKDEIIIPGGFDVPVEISYNRDFFTYNSNDGTLTFTGETGEWDIYYSSRYKYFFVLRASDVAPVTYWIIGSGFATPPEWHSDFNSGGWDFNTILRLGYMKPLGDSKYQITMFLNGGFDIQIYAQRSWNNVFVPSFIGDCAGVYLHPNTNADICANDDFSPGYYRLILNLTAKTLNFEKL